MISTLLTLFVLSITPEPLPSEVSATIQAEKLRMNVLELREVVRTDQSLKAAALLFAGGYQLASSALLFHGTDLQKFGAGLGMALGLGISIWGLVYALKQPPENDLWEEISALRQRGLSPTIFVAEAEAIYAAAVEDAAASRKRWGYAFMGVGLGLGTFLGVSTYRGGGNLREVTASVLLPAGLLIYGIFMRFIYRLPTERAWDAYLNDKNLPRPYASVEPLFGATSESAFAGARVAF